jgi:uncharacterized protein YjeT (DUF2065 family)
LPTVADSTLYQVEAIAVALLVAAMLVWALYRALARTRPELRIGVPTAVSFGLHLATPAAISNLSSSRSLRGGDELLFMSEARALAGQPLHSSEFTDALLTRLHEWVFALQVKLADFPDDALRITQVGIGAVGVLLMAVAVYDLAGPRAAYAAAWLLGLEPATLFFSGLLHKEALMVLASGLVVYGGAQIWRELRLHGLVLMAAGCFVAVATRSYAGWFLVGACVVLIVHSGLRHLPALPARSAMVLVATTSVIALSIPAVLQASSTERLSRLQLSQDANVKQTDANLRLEAVDFSTREKILRNLPTRVVDLTFRPYLWQVSNTSQQLGVIGSLVALATLLILIRTLFVARGEIFARAGPLLYPLIFLLIAYSLSAGNAGTSFRYRTHLVGLALGAVVAVRLGRRPERTPDPEPGQAEPPLGRRLPAGSAA